MPRLLLSLLCAALAGALQANVPLRNPKISGDAGGVLSGTFTVQSGATLALASGATFTAADPITLASGGLGVALTDPGADRLLFWDDSAGAVAWLQLGTGLSITGTTINGTSGFANPMTTAGDLIVGGASGAAGRLGVGTDGQVLTVVSGAPAWAADLGAGGAPDSATYIVQTPSTGLSAEQALSALATGLLKNTTTTGVLSIAAAATDFVAPGAIFTSGLTMNTARLLGRTTASAGAVEEITVGSGLSLSGGTLSATGGGGGGTGTLTLQRFNALDNQPPATGFATFDTRNAIAVLDFDAATDESAVFVGIVPEAASLASGLEIRLVWMATTATTGSVVWNTSLERGNTDLDADSFASAVAGTAVTNATSGIVTITSILHGVGEIDGLAVGELFRLKVSRDADNGADTLTGDAELIAVEVRAR